MAKKIVIVGAGVAGCLAAYLLSCNAQVTVLERHPLTTLSYTSLPVALLCPPLTGQESAFNTLQKLHQHLQAQGLFSGMAGQTLYYTPSTPAEHKAWQHHPQLHTCDTRALPSELHDIRWPLRVAFAGAGSWVHMQPFLHNLRAAATQQGVVIHSGTEIRGISEQSGRLYVGTSEGRHHADLIVIASGSERRHARNCQVTLPPWPLGIGQVITFAQETTHQGFGLIGSKCDVIASPLGTYVLGRLQAWDIPESQQQPLHNIPDTHPTLPTPPSFLALRKQGGKLLPILNELSATHLWTGITYHNTPSRSVSLLELRPGVMFLAGRGQYGILSTVAAIEALKQQLG